jgi:hypothetical protein
VTEAAAREEHEPALTVCDTGLDMAITTKKVPAVRAFATHDGYRRNEPASRTTRMC